jgi:hypothetical protein
MHLKKSTGLPGGGGMVRVLPTEDDGNPMVDKKFFLRLRMLLVGNSCPMVRLKQ